MRYLLSGMLAWLFVFTTAYAQEQINECERGQVGGQTLGWCIHLTDRTKNPDVLYYFHAALGSERSWMEQKQTQRIRQIWQQQGLAAPTVISISFGSLWLPSEDSGRLRLFIDQIMPLFEEKIGGVQGRRMVLGRSMGGRNAATVLMQNPQLFSKVAIACPALPAIGPYSTPQEIEAYLTRHQGYISKFKVNAMLSWLKDEYKSESSWKRQEPLQLVQKAPLLLPPTFVSCGDKDEYGFFEGAKYFSEVAASSGVSVEWHPVAGGHCQFDEAAVANFLIR